MIFIVGGATYEESKVVQMLNVQAKREGALPVLLVLSCLRSCLVPAACHAGVTCGCCAEAFALRPFAAGSNSRYILGGTSVMNSKTFVDVRCGDFVSVRRLAVMYAPSASLECDCVRADKRLSCRFPMRRC